MNKKHKHITDIGSTVKSSGWCNEDGVSTITFMHWFSLSKNKL